MRARERHARHRGGPFGHRRGGSDVDLHASVSCNGGVDVVNEKNTRVNDLKHSAAGYGVVAPVVQNEELDQSVIKPFDVSAVDRGGVEQTRGDASGRS